MSSICAVSARLGCRLHVVAAVAQPRRSVTVGIVGGSGFVGCRTAVRLSEAGYSVRIIARHPHHIQRQVKNEDMIIEEGFTSGGNVRRRHRPGLKSKIKEGLASIGESQERDDSVPKIFMEFAEANASKKGNNDELRAALTGCDGVINCVGILAEGVRRGSFDNVHHQAAASVAALSKEVGVKRLVHISAIGASDDSNSSYSRSKAQGEAAVIEQFPRATILRPSLVVGRGDGFFSLFDRMARLSPILPLVGGGHAKFQPVHIDDVAEACIAVLTTGQTQGKTYELGGPDVFTFKELLKMMLEADRRKRILLPIPMPMAYLQAMVLQYLPGKVLTLDQVRLLQQDNVVSPSALSMADLGMVDPLSVSEALEDIFKYRRL
ncbi:uncharacterized protein LOC135814960 [Sycon ciliatum]|uniref:uncharacterized protein LOC135814960 n=1 Tax=Sycon ciliatum TaxID=27933 RepID=UPI0031F68890